jgi:pimeloyl-ACP methyl ester carboxylesterase
MLAALDQGRDEDALEIFLRDMVKLDPPDLEAARASPGWSHRVEIIWTMRRETSALAQLDPNIERYGSIDQPVELVVGDQTARHHTEAVDALQATLRRAHTRVLPGQGHGALLRGPQLIAATINEHLNTR